MSDTHPRERVFNGLLVYCGVWQLGHLVSNAWGILGDRDYAMELLGGSMTPAQFDVLLVTGWIDLVLVSPLGILAAAMLLAGRQQWAGPLATVSAWLACYSAYAYTYLHLQYGTLPLDATNLLMVWATFIPVPAFAIWSVFRLARRRD